ncbi:MAG: hypothetical protein EA356_14715 [Geminicoccaceae bacterium]|nr:MAG: hypothetical protein EA356_14715 [Geminicoccaceae bacterium]
MIDDRNGAGIDILTFSAGSTAPGSSGGPLWFETAADVHVVGVVSPADRGFSIRRDIELSIDYIAASNALIHWEIGAVA